MTCSVIIPAFNEEQVLGRLLDALNDPEWRDDLDVIVVCNGCTDNTERVASSHPLAPRVAALTEGSKHKALVVGDELATGFPRFYVDADIEIAAGDICRLASELEGANVLAVAPERDLRLDGSAWAVRAYYRVWQGLPAVRDGLFGRGVLGVSEAGFARIAARPDVLGDDLFVHSRFSSQERRVSPQARSVIFGPRTTRDLVRRRVRAAQGNSSLRRDGLQGPSTGSSVRQVARFATQRPAELPSVLVFLAVTGTSRFLARWRRDSLTWLRDESSRGAAT